MLPKLVSFLFLLLLCAVPAGQAAWELARGEDVQAFGVFGPFEEERLRAFEDDLREASFLHARVTPWYQLALTRVFGRGNEKATIGADDWLYYSEDLDLVTRDAIETGEAWTPAKAIADFQSQLAVRGVKLLLVPVPAKSTTDPGHLSRWTRGLSSTRNPGTPAFFAELQQLGVRALDLALVYSELRGDGADLYLPRDTHWTPRTMERVAREIALAARELMGSEEALPDEITWRVEPDLAQGVGDIVGMLRLPEGIELYPAMELELSRIVHPESGATFAPDPGAAVLVLGDSFTRAFSDPKLGLGTGAGLAEHLAKELSIPVDVIAIAGGSARAAREALARREGGLAEKKLVVWQISMRDLVGDARIWERVELTQGAEAAPAAEQITVRGRIVEVSRVPAEFDYELCLAIFEYEVVEVLEGVHAADRFWVAHVAIEGFEDTQAASFQVGELQRLALENVDDHYDLEQTAWIDDTDAGRTIWFPTAVERE